MQTAAHSEGKGVLLVEDDGDIREVLLDLLGSEGIAVDSAKNGVEALEYLRTHATPSVILLDWRMPVMGGEQFLERHRREKGEVNVPVIVLSADRGEASKAMSLGVDAYVAKPVDFERLLATIDAVRKR